MKLALKNVLQNTQYSTSNVKTTLFSHDTMFKKAWCTGCCTLYILAHLFVIS